MDYIKLRYIINTYITYIDYVFIYLYFIQKCDNSLPVCCLCLDLVMISNLVFKGADDQVDDFKEPHARGRYDTTL